MEEINQNKNELKVKEMAFDSQISYEKILGDNNVKCSKYMIYFLNAIFYLQENILKNMNFEVCNVFASHGFEIAENKIYDFCSDFLNNLEEVIAKMLKNKYKMYFIHFLNKISYNNSKFIYYILRAIIMLFK